MVLGIFFGLAVNAQDQNSSPYTRFGIGDQIPMVTTPFVGLGGASVAISDFKYLNYSNPATYSNTKQYSPVFDAGVMGKTSFLKSEEGSYTQTTVMLRNFSLLLPVSRKTGVAFGLLPYSTTGYDISNFDPNEGDTITYNYSGTGSVNRLFLGLGQQIINKGDSVRLSIGANVSFLFGTLQRDRKVEFQDVTYYNTHLKNKLIIRGFSLDYGMHYFEKVSKKLTYEIGLTANLGNKVNAYQDFFAYTYKLNSINQEVISDTTQYYEDQKGYVQLPKSFAIGGAVTFNKRVTLTAQYDMSDMQNYYEWFDSVETRYTELAQKQKLSLGVKLMPKPENNVKDISAIKLSTYQFGVHYGYAPYRRSDIHLKEYGIAFGMTIPMLSSGSASTINIGLELGKLGTTENGLIEDNYFKFSVGLSLLPHIKYDKWFWKRLYD